MPNDYISNDAYFISSSFHFENVPFHFEKCPVQNRDMAASREAAISITASFQWLCVVTNG